MCMCKCKCQCVCVCVYEPIALAEPRLKVRCRGSPGPLRSATRRLRWPTCATRATQISLCGGRRDVAQQRETGPKASCGVQHIARVRESGLGLVGFMIELGAERAYGHWPSLVAPLRFGAAYSPRANHSLSARKIFDRATPAPHSSTRSCATSLQ